MDFAWTHTQLAHTHTKVPGSGQLKPLILVRVRLLRDGGGLSGHKLIDGLQISSLHCELSAFVPVQQYRQDALYNL